MKVWHVITRPFSNCKHNPWGYIKMWSKLNTLIWLPPWEEKLLFINRTAPKLLFEVLTPPLNYSTLKSSTVTQTQIQTALSSRFPKIIFDKMNTFYKIHLCWLCQPSQSYPQLLHSKREQAQDSRSCYSRQMYYNNMYFFFFFTSVVRNIWNF